MCDATTQSATRVCSRCGNTKPMADFRLSAGDGGYSDACWVCRWAAATTGSERLAALPPGPFDRWPEADPNGPRLTHVCRTCGREKSLAEFTLDYARGRRRSPCRACARAKGRQYYAAHRERVLARHRESVTPEVLAGRRARYARSVRRQSEKGAIRRRTKRLRLLGRLSLAERCEECGGPATEVHHETYGDVCALMSLCRRCHMTRHFRVWRKTGGGPVRYPQEYEEGGESGQ